MSRAAAQIAELHKQGGARIDAGGSELYDALANPEAVKDFYQNGDLISMTRGTDGNAA